MSATVFPSYVRFECDKCGESETFDTPLVKALAVAFNSGWRAAGADFEDGSRHYCAGCYTPKLYDDLESELDGAEDAASESRERIDELEGMDQVRDEKIIELEEKVRMLLIVVADRDARVDKLERELHEAQDHKRI